MVVCKFFMDGYCKFGSGCKFEHDNSYREYDPGRQTDYSGERPSGTSILKSNGTSSFGEQKLDQSFIQNPQQTSFIQNSQQTGFIQNTQQSGFVQITQQPGFIQNPQQTVFIQNTQQTGFIQTPQQTNYQQNPPVGLKFNVQEIMHVISKDILQLEKGNQWQLSSYSPLKELSNMPGLEDHAPEELRWECYKALQSGTLPLWLAIVQQLYANVAKINNDMKKKDTAYHIVDRWLRDIEQKSVQSNIMSEFGGSIVTSPMMTDGGQIGNVTNDMQSGNSFVFNLGQVQYPTSGSVFTSGQSTIPLTSNNNLQSFSSEAVPNIDQDVYSNVKELNEKELEAFKADKFVFGAIPTNPPPKMFCNL